MDYERYHEENHLKIEIADRIAIVTLDRPDKRNAIDYKLHEGLERALPQLGFDPDVGAIVLTGAGSAFCAGGDLTGFYPPGASGPYGGAPQPRAQLCDRALRGAADRRRERHGGGPGRDDRADVRRDLHGRHREDRRHAPGRCALPPATAGRRSGRCSSDRTAPRNT